MIRDLRRHVAGIDSVIKELSANVLQFPTQSARLDLALFYAVRMGAAANDIGDLSPSEMRRLYQQIAERIALALQTTASDSTVE